MGRRRRTLLNAPTGRTLTAPPARTREGMPAAAESTASYAGPIEPDENEGLTTDPTEEDIPTEVAPRPYDKATDDANPTTAPAPEIDQKPESADDLVRPASTPDPAEGYVPALVMIGVISLIAAVIAGLTLLTR